MVYAVGLRRGIVDNRKRIPPPLYGAGIPFFKSDVSFQRGHGLGSILGRLVKTIIPVISKRTVKKGLTKLGKAAVLASLQAGEKALTNPDVNFKEALKESGKLQTQRIIKEAKETFSDKRKGKTIKGRRLVRSPRYPVNRPRRERDIFDKI